MEQARLLFIEVAKDKFERVNVTRKGFWGILSGLAEVDGGNEFIGDLDADSGEREEIGDLGDLDLDTVVEGFVGEGFDVVMVWYGRDVHGHFLKNLLRNRPTRKIPNQTPNRKN